MLAKLGPLPNELQRPRRADPRDRHEGALLVLPARRSLDPVVDLGLPGLPNVVGIDSIRLVITRLKVPLIFKSRPYAPQPAGAGNAVQGRNRWGCPVYRGQPLV